MSNSETETKSKVVDRKKYDAKYYEKVAGIKVACDVCNREVVRRHLASHKRTKTCQKVAGEQLRGRILKMMDEAGSSSDGEPVCHKTIYASKEETEMMWGETRLPGFDFDEWFARWCPDDGQTVCYSIEDEYERW